MIDSGRFDWVGRRWNHFWFEPGQGSTLGGARIAFFLLVFLFYVGRPLAPWADVPAAFWMPTLLFRLLHIPLLPGWVLTAVDVSWKAALALSAIGLFTRYSTIVAAVLGFYVLGLPHNFGKVHHSDTLVVLLMFVFAASRCGDACSVDRLRRLASPEGKRLPASLPPDPEYTWPRRLALCLLVLAFAGAALSKLRNSGFAWAFSDNMRNTLLVHYYDHRPPTSLGLFVASNSTLTHALAAGSLAMEMGVILALFGPRLRAFFVTGLGFMQIGIWLMMGVLFLGYASVYPVLVPWAEVAAAARRQLGIRGRVVMLFDGSCGICTRTMRVLRAVDVLGRIEFLDVVGQWPVIAARYPGLDRLPCLADMHVLASDSDAKTGFLAYRRLAWRLPIAWLILPFLYLPPVPQVGGLIYRRIADDRMSHGCELPWAGSEPS